MVQQGGPGADSALRLQGARRRVIALNIGVVLLVVWLHVSGLVTAFTRMRLAPGQSYVPPTWLPGVNGLMFSITGGVAAVAFTVLLVRLWPAAFRGFQMKRTAP